MAFLSAEGWGRDGGGGAFPRMPEEADFLKKGPLLQAFASSRCVFVQKILY
jgi:hypothetical protein